MLNAPSLDPDHRHPCCSWSFEQRLWNFLLNHPDGDVLEIMSEKPINCLKQALRRKRRRISMQAIQTNKLEMNQAKKMKKGNVKKKKNMHIRERKSNDVQLDASYISNRTWWSEISRVEKRLLVQRLPQYSECVCNPSNYTDMLGSVRNLSQETGDSSLISRLWMFICARSISRSDFFTSRCFTESLHQLFMIRSSEAWVYYILSFSLNIPWGYHGG